ncbi:MAG TPA: RDD family protein, partial [Nocardioides sp.]|nr:RDD family protein [Nocardioides sp.]
HYGWLQGAKGYTLGKHAAHIRVIGPDGNVPGFLRSLLRTIVWLVDAAPWCLPGLLGFILVTTTRGHRRLGDMAADTYVVTEDYVRAPQPQS